MISSPALSSSTPELHSTRTRKSLTGSTPELGLRARTSHSGSTPELHCGRPSSGAGMLVGRKKTWKNFSEDCGDISAAMDAVQRVMKKKDMAREADELQHSIEEADRRNQEQAEELKARETRKQQEREEEQRRAISRLKAAMRKGNVKALRKALDEAVAVGVPEAIMSVPKTLWRLESQLHASMAAGNLAEVRKVVEEVERGLHLARFPQEAPFALEQPLQYWSERKEDWVDCYVTDIAADHQIQISLKKKAGHWYSVRSQGEKFRVVDANLAAVAPQVRLEDARVLLGKASALESALLSEDVDKVSAVMAEAESEKALASLVRKAQTFVQEASKARAEAEAARRSKVALAWHSAKKNIRAALRAESERPSSSAGTRGLDKLERDLEIERLSVAFDSTCLNSLESTLERLESEEAVLPANVIQEARQALKGIAAQHEELKEAISKGDTDGIAAALELSAEHLLPEGLVRQARLALEAVTSLERAVRSRDPRVLSDALAQLSKEFTELPIVQRARAVLAAASELEQAVSRGDFAAMKTALGRVDERLLPEELVNKSKLVASIDEAIRLQDSSMLADVLSRVAGLSADMPLVERARGMHRVLEALQAAVDGGRPEDLHKAIEDAQKEGVLPETPPMPQALGLVRAASVLQAAVDGGKPDVIEEAIRVAEAEGLPPSFIDPARRELTEKKARMAAEAVQEAALLGTDAEALEELIQVAKAQGVSDDVLDKARQDCAEVRAKNAREVLVALMQGDDVEAIEDAMQLAGAQGVPESFIAQCRQQLEDERNAKIERQRVETLRRRREAFLAGLPNVQRDNVAAMRAALVEGEDLLTCDSMHLEEEVDSLRKSLQEELDRRLTKAKAARAEHEKLASEYKSAKEAQDCGGSVLAAQWRTAMKELSKPLTIDED